MQQRLSLVTLAVKDLAASKRFYDALGWRPKMAVEEVVFYQLPGMVFGLFRRDAYAKDVGVPEDSLRPGAVALAHNVGSRAEVDTVFGAVEAAGARIVRPPRATPWGGYSGYFADPDGHLWEVAHNPGWTLAEDGAVTMP